MTPLLEQFLAESREGLQGIGEQLLALERAPDDLQCMNELFRLVHTLKGNSGLFEFPEMTRALHAAEDLMDAVRDGRVGYSRALADQLLDAMDFVGLLLDDIETGGGIAAGRMAVAVQVGAGLRALLAAPAPDHPPPAAAAEPAASLPPPALAPALLARLREALALVPDALRLELYRLRQAGTVLHWVGYAPEEECFYKGEDPLFQILQLENVYWRRVRASEDWPPLAELDAYRCLLRFELITALDAAALAEHFRYVPEQIEIVPLPAWVLVQPSGAVAGGPEVGEFVRGARALLDAGEGAALVQAARTLLELAAADLWIASALRWLLATLESEPDARQLHLALIEAIERLEMPALPSVAPSAPRQLEAGAPSVAPPALPLTEDAAWSFNVVFEAQREVLSLSDQPEWLAGRLRGVAASLAGALGSVGRESARAALDQALDQALTAGTPAPLLDWLDRQPSVEFAPAAAPVPIAAPTGAPTGVPPPAASVPRPPPPAPTAPPAPSGADDEEPVRFGRRADDQLPGPRTLKVEQSKIDRLMNLIGEMVVAKNALPYLAGRAERVHGVRELAREIKAQYGVINRIAEEMQDAIMQVRMMPVSFVFQRFPRLVRDLARKLGKEVRLVMEGESTEADKNIIEALADPLIHILRNSLDHGLETPAERLAAGKPPEGRLTIRASQVSDRVLIEIGDDGRGIDPATVRRKAYERGLLDEAALERLSDREAVNLVFAAGFSTAAQVSDLSGRGVGMDVVRSAIARVNGGVELESAVGRGTWLRLSLPLSMAVTNVMIIETDGQRFGVPMEAVAETVRIPRQAIRAIKQRQTTVLRGRVVPLVALNELLALDADQCPNDDDEYAALVVRIDQEHLGIIVDDCRETVDIILKPLAGILGGLGGYAGSALLGDGSVLMVLNPRELLQS